MTASEFRVLFEDNHCLAVEKQAGQLIARTRLALCASDLAKQYLAEIQQARKRLSGCRSPSRQTGLGYCSLHANQPRRPLDWRSSFARRPSQDLPRLGSGALNADSEMLEDWLLRSTNRNVTRVSREGVEGAKLAQLTYSVQERASDRTLLEIELHTGRHHQIRVQLSSRGWPILGDVKYGGPKCNNPKALALHAASLSFEHPTTRERVELSADVPAAWKNWFYVHVTG